MWQDMKRCVCRTIADIERRDENGFDFYTANCA